MNDAKHIVHIKDITYQHTINELKEYDFMCPEYEYDDVCTQIQQNQKHIIKFSMRF